jgi:hypothetical protein
LTEFVRGYLRHLAERGTGFHLAGVDREGAFVNHCTQVGPWLKAEGDGAVFVPDNRYVLERVKHTGGASAIYTPQSPPVGRRASMFPSSMGLLFLPLGTVMGTATAMATGTALAQLPPSRSTKSRWSVIASSL